MDLSVKWVEDVMFVAESDSGHAIVLDGAAEGGGRNRGMRPLELMALSVGSCSSYDVVSILRKARQDISGCEASIKAQRVDAVPAVFESIHLHFTVTGKALSDKQVERAVSLSADKYCSASIMLRDAGVKITHSYEVLEG
ncbi:OsmC family protein [Gammaproteobacteria bacterium]|jgi:putative redox protein|nr:OsmC family protein [Gammaproteobacteria bacterium]